VSDWTGGERRLRLIVDDELIDRFVGEETAPRKRPLVGSMGSRPAP
jgi:hypothetical protein